MHKRLIVLTTIVLAAGLSACATTGASGISTPEQAAVMQPVRQFIDGFNAGDVPKALAACTDPITIVDEIPPYTWHGAGASDAWMAAYDAGAREHGISDGHVALGTPRHVDISGDRAYVVAPVDYTYREKGQQKNQIGSTLTAALVKTAAGWRITSWCWSKH